MKTRLKKMYVRPLAEVLGMGDVCLLAGSKFKVTIEGKRSGYNTEPEDLDPTGLQVSGSRSGYDTETEDLDI